MSVYRPKRSDGSLKSQVYHYDFRLRPKAAGTSVRFHGSTGQTTKPAARRVEAKLRERAATGELSSGMTINEACWRYWGEVHARQRSADDQARNLEIIKKLFGGETLLVDISTDDIANAVRRRAAQEITRWRKVDGREVLKGTGRLVSNSTVNRTVLEVMRRLLRRAKRVWKVPVDPEGIDWRHLRLPEPEGRTREMQPEEEARFVAALRADYRPIVTFLLLSGRRRGDVTGMLKFKVDLSAGTVRWPLTKKHRTGEQARRLGPTLLAIVATEMARTNGEAVWTYVVQKGAAKGERRRITDTGLRREVNRALDVAGISDFRCIHDLRHTFASRLLRATGNLKITQEALGHSDIASTVRYAHVLEDDVVDAMEAMASRNYPGMRIETVGGNK